MQPRRLRSPSLLTDSRRSSGAFTLLEVLLAVAIAAGMLAIVLFFYTQAANLRVQLFYETSRISAARLLLDRLTTELSNARRCTSFQIGLHGGTDRIEFVRLDVPNSLWWTNSLDAASMTPSSPFRLIRYAALRSLGGTNISGLTRSEEPLVKKSIEPAEEGEVSPTNSIPTRRSPAVIEQFQFIRFRYWNGTSWLDSWAAPELPYGVEVSLGAEPLPDGTSPDEYPYELFRRTIYLSGHARDSGGHTQGPLSQEDAL